MLAIVTGKQRAVVDREQLVTALAFAQGQVATERTAVATCSAKLEACSVNLQDLQDRLEASRRQLNCQSDQAQDLVAALRHVVGVSDGSAADAALLDLLETLSLI